MYCQSLNNIFNWLGLDKVCVQYYMPNSCSNIWINPFIKRDQYGLSLILSLKDATFNKPNYLSWLIINVACWLIINRYAIIMQCDDPFQTICGSF